MKIAQKLGLLVGALLTAVLITIIVLSAQVGSTSSQYNKLINNDIAQREKANSMLVVFGQQVLDLQQILLQSTDAPSFKRNVAAFKAQDKAVNDLVADLLKNVDKTKDPRLATSLTQFQSTHKAVDTQYQAALDTFADSDYKGVVPAAVSVAGVEDFANSLVNNIVNYRQLSVDAAIKAQSDGAARRLKIIYAVGALLLLLAAGAVTLVVRGIVGPVRSLTTAALEAANDRLPRVVAEIANLPAGSPPPSLPRFKVTTRDELAELASALSSLQDSAVGLALEQKRDEEANTETLVNLGRRNQSLLTRMLSYVTELERNERDAEALDKLFRLDHLTTRIRRNAESLLVLAGAKQTRTWSYPIAMDDVLRAALSEIEEYTRVTIHHMDHAKVHGSVAADLTHMIAELLENGTRFSPRERQVVVVGRLTPSGYQFDLIDAGLGMPDDELEQANIRISQDGQRRPDTKVLGHHVVGRIASRRGIFVQLLPSDQVGLTAMVLVPVVLLSDAVIPSSLQEVTEVPMISPIPLPEPAPSQAPALSLAPAPSREPARNSAPAPAAYPSYSEPAVPNPAEWPPLRSPAPQAPAASSDLAPMSNGGRNVPGRRVRGAQLGDLGPSEGQQAPTPIDANQVRSQMSSLQTGVAAARREHNPQQPQQPQQPQPPQRDYAPPAAPARDYNQQPAAYNQPQGGYNQQQPGGYNQAPPARPAVQAPPARPAVQARPQQPQPVRQQAQPPAPPARPAPQGPPRRVRGAQLAELGADGTLEGQVPPRDPAAIGRQLSGLQAATNRASRETSRFNDDDTRGSNK
jgi:hypothetical protein